MRVFKKSGLKVTNKRKKENNKIRYGRPLNPDTDNMVISETQKNMFHYCTEEMVRYSDNPGLCDVCCRNVDRYIISEPEWEGWESYRKNLDISQQELATDSDKNFELHLCTECIASGKAAEKFHIRFFNIPKHISDERRLKGYDELKFRTPDHISCKAVDSKCVPHHCAEVCELVARSECGKEIPNEMQGRILPYADSEFKYYEVEDFDPMYVEAQQTFIFKCKQCGQYMAIFY